MVISNCVINLSTDRARVLDEAFRVLKPGGRFAVSDVVFLGGKSKLPAGLVKSVESWAGCVSGALEKDGYERLLREAGFEGVAVEVTHACDTSPVTDSGCCRGDTVGETSKEVPLASAFIRGRKPSERETL